jgi:hypothetical protein
MGNRRTGIAKQEEDVLNCSEGDTAEVTDIDGVLMLVGLAPGCTAGRPGVGIEVVAVEKDGVQGGGDGSTRGDVHGWRLGEM